MSGRTVKFAASAAGLVAAFVFGGLKDWSACHPWVAGGIVLGLGGATLLAGFLIDLQPHRKRAAACRRLEKRTRALIDNTVVELPGTGISITRDEIDELHTHLDATQRVVVTGAAGTGKTGIVTLLAKKSRRPVIVLDARDIYDCGAFEAVSRRLGISGIDIVEALCQWGKAHSGVLLIDQCDSVWRTNAGGVVVDIARNCCNEPSLGVILVTRIHEGRGLDEALRRPGSPDPHIFNVAPLKRQAAGALLGRLGVESPSDEILELSRNLLDLSLIADLVVSEGVNSLEPIQNRQGLWDRYRASLAKEGPSKDLAPGIPTAAINLAIECIGNPRSSCVLDPSPTNDQERLVSRRVIIKDRGERFRFRHEEFRDYLYAWDAINRREFGPDEVKDEIGPGRLGVLAPWLFSLSMGGGQHDLAAQYVGLLND